MAASEDSGKTIVIRDRRKPNQYTTDNVVAREWLPILRVGDAFFFYSVYLSMANKETESSWGSLRTLAQYLQCGVDLIIRGNKLLEICELIHIETGNQRTSNEYYILDPPSLNRDLVERIHHRLDDIVTQESSKNWQAWANKVRQAIDRHRSLPSIWAERRAKRGGRPVKTQHRHNPARESQPGLLEKGVRESQPQRTWATTSAHVTHTQGGRESQPEQEQETRKHEQESKKDPEPSLLLVQKRCRHLEIAPQVTDVLIEKHGVPYVALQLAWLPFRHARDPAAMLVSAVQKQWAQPEQYDVDRSQAIWAEWMHTETEEQPSVELGTTVERPSTAGEDLEGVEQNDVDAADLWTHVLEELRMQMTRATFDTWLGGSQVIGLRDGEVTVRLRDEYAVQWLRTRWVGPIERTVAGVLGRSASIRFEV